MRKLVWAPGIALLILFISFAFSYSSNVLLSDQWDYFLPVFEDQSLWDSFRLQHGPHRQGLGGFVEHVWANLFAMQFDWQACLQVLLLALGAILFYRLSSHFSEAPHTGWQMLIPFLFLKVSAWELLWFVPNAAHSIVPILLILGMALILLKDRSPKHSLALGVLCFFASHTGFAIFALPALGTVLFLKFLRERKAPAGIELVALALSLMLFLWGYRFDQHAASCDPSTTPILQRAQYFLALIPLPFGVMGTSFRSSLLFLLGFVLPFTLLLRNGTRLNSKQKDVLWFLGLFVLIFAAANTWGRSCAGAHAAQSSRYVLLMSPLTWIFFLWAQKIPWSRMTSWSKIYRTAFTFLVLTSSLILPTTRKANADRDLQLKLSWHDCYKKNRSVEECDKLTNFSLHPSKDLVEQRLKWLESKRWSLFRD